MVRTRGITFFFLLALFWCGTVICQSNDDKFRQLVKLAQKNPVIHFNNGDTYHKLVSEPGRNYSVLVLFTATAAKYKCGPCAALAEEFKKFGASYEAYFGDYTHNQEFLAQPFFIAQLEPDNCMDVFQGYQFSTVPHMVFIPSGTKKVTKFREDQYFRNPQANIHDIIDFINKKVGVEIPVYQSITERLTPVAMVLVMAFLLTRIVRKYQKSFYSPMLWYALAVITYMIVMAGVVYNRIRNPPFMDMQQNGRMQLIAPQPRTQYVAEGMIISVVLAGAGLLFVVLGDVVPRLSPSYRRTAFWVSAVLLFMFLATLNSIIIYFILNYLCTIGYVFDSLVDIYRMKYGAPAFRLNWRLFF